MSCPMPFNNIEKHRKGGCGKWSKVIWSLALLDDCKSVSTILQFARALCNQHCVETRRRDYDHTKIVYQRRWERQKKCIIKVTILQISVNLWCTNCNIVLNRNVTTANGWYHTRCLRRKMLTRLLAAGSIDRVSVVIYSTLDILSEWRFRGREGLVSNI